MRRIRLLPEDEAGTTYCYIPVISSRYDMDTDAELPMIFIEITDAVIIYPTSAMESVYEKNSCASVSGGNSGVG